jgi:hypothetical protein
LTRAKRPLYSARFARLPSGEASEGPCGGTGRRARLKIEFRKECWFDSGQGHHSIFRHLKLLSFRPKGPGAPRTGTWFGQMHGVTSHPLLISGARVQFRLPHRTPTEDGHECFAVAPFSAAIVAPALRTPRAGPFGAV